MSSNHHTIIGIICKDTVAKDAGFVETVSNDSVNRYIPYGNDGVEELVVIPLLENCGDGYEALNLANLQKELSSEKYAKVLKEGGQLSFGAERP